MAMAFSIIFSQCAVTLFDAKAADAVEYDRVKPEAAILNANTGTETAFYESLKTEAHNKDYPGYYNAVGLFSGGKFTPLSYDSGVYDDSTGTDDGRIYFGGETGMWGKSVLREISKSDKNLAVNFSASLYNNIHSHKVSTFKKQDVKAFEKVSLFMSNSWCASHSGAYTDMETEYARFGDYDGITDGYHTLGYINGTVGESAFLKFEKSTVTYANGNKTCSCGGAAANKMLITYRDMKAPCAPELSYSTDGGKNYKKANEKGYIGTGTTIILRLTFDEPIRFADDDKNHGDLYLELRQRGATAGDKNPRAMLKALSGNSLYFEYTVKKTDGTFRVAGVYSDSLFGSGLELKQVVNDKSFTLEKSGEGFAETTSYITDIAGNAITKSTLSLNVDIDNEPPKVDEVIFDAALNNTEVTEALGFDDDNNSHRYLGEGDSVSVMIRLDEVTDAVKKTSIYSGLTAVTNILVTDGVVNSNLGNMAISGLSTKKINGKNYLALTSSHAWNTEADGEKDSVTAFLMPTIPIHQNLETDDGGTIKIKSLEFESPVSDLAGNTYSETEVSPSASSNSFLIDNEGAEVTDKGFTKKGDGFAYSFEIADSASGAEGIYGSFKLNNGGDGKAYKYEYAALTKASDTPEKWIEATTGDTVKFIQHDKNAIHIRAKSGEEYEDLSDCTIEVTAKDCAGNEKSYILPDDTAEAPFVIDWFVDGVGPVITLGEVERSLTASGGEITVNLEITDRSGVSSVEYSWDNKATWSNAAGGYKAFANVSDKTKFSKELFVRAKDSKGNETVTSLGTVTYDLSEAKYALSYKESIEKKTELYLNGIEYEDEILLMTVIPPEFVGGEENHCAVIALTTTDSLDGVNIFGYSTTMGNHWYHMTFEENNGIYSFDTVESDGGTSPNAAYYSTNGYIQGWWRDIVNGKYSGELKITVLSGKKAAFIRYPDGTGTPSVDRYAPVSAGNSEYSVSKQSFMLRVVGESESFDNVTLTTDENIAAKKGSFPVTVADEKTVSDISGVTFNAVIGKDKFGWNYDNLKIEDSFIIIKNVNSGAEELRVKLSGAATSRDGEQLKMSIKIPEHKFPTGMYDISLFLACRAGNGTEVSLGYDVFIDATEPDNNFSLSSILYTPASSVRHVELSNLGIGQSERVTGSGTIYLPSYGQFDKNAYHSDLYTLTVSTPGETVGRYLNKNMDAFSYSGQYSVVMWNTDESLSGRVMELNVYGTDESKVVNKYGSKGMENGLKGFYIINPGDELADGNDNLYLLANRVNTVGVKKVYANGKESETKYYNIYPDEGYIRGEISKEPGSLIFTPEAGADLEGAKVYAYSLTSSRTENVSTFRAAEEMIPASDGTYRIPLAADGADYIIMTVNKYGTVYKAALDAVDAPWFSPEPEIVTDSDGKFEIRFRTMINEKRQNEGDRKITVQFTGDYAKLLDSDKFTFTFKKDWGRYDWEADSPSPTGIYKVSANLGADVLTLDKFYSFIYLDTVIYGVLPDTAGEKTAVTATVTAEDALKLSGTASLSSSETTGKIAVKEVTYEPGRLNIVFNQPVRPAESFVWKNKDDSGSYFKSEWINSFPVTENGEHEISYYDVFGKLRTETINLADTFIYNGTDYGIHIELSPEENTTEHVLVSAKAHGDGKVIFKERYDDGEMAMTPVEGSATEPTVEKTVKVTENQWVKVYRTNSSGYIGRDSVSIKVYVDNIIDGAPIANVKYYVESLGREFGYAELSDYIEKYHGGTFETNGRVTAYYKTSRHVTPLNDETHIYTSEEKIYTFRYIDDFGNEGSTDAPLPEGLVLTEPKLPPVDREAPIVYVDIYAKRFEKYSKEDAFNASSSAALMKESFDAVGTVQGYSLKLTVKDESPYEIKVTGSDNAVLSGNSINISLPEDFTVTVTDEAGNATEFTVTEEMLSYIDNIVPRAKTEIVKNGMYTREGYIRLYDVDDEGNELTGAGHSVTLETPSGLLTEDRNGETWYKVPFDSNTSVHFTFHDEAGNYASGDIYVTDIDTEPPTLSTSWSPSYTYYEDGETKFDDAMHTEGPTNSNITAHVKVSSPIINAVIGTADGRKTVIAPDGVNYWLVLGGYVTVKAAPDLITVTYEDNYDGNISIRVTAQNGQTAETYLAAVGNVIDKKSPSVSCDYEPLVRTGSGAPYGYCVTVTPDEEVRFMNKGAKNPDGTRALYSPGEPLKLNYYEDTEEELIFTDNAGNIGRYKVQVSGLDKKAPVLTLIYPDGNPDLIKPTAENVFITVRSDEDCTLYAEDKTVSLKKDVDKKIELSENGTHVLLAVDGAGNRSEYTVTVNCIDRTLPMISFDSSTVYGFAGMTEEELKALLNTGYTAWDNVEKDSWPKVSIDTSEIDTAAAGAYKAYYTVTDEAGNSITVPRFIRILGSGTLYLKVNGEAVLPDSTKEIKTGKVTLSVSGLKDGEPYTVKIRRGLKSKGQMKYLKESTVKFENGECTIESPGYYTVLVTTQSRQTVLLRLYAEN